MMKKLLLFLASVIALVSCKGSSDVPFTELDRYYFKNGQEIPGNPKIDSAEAFSELFGVAAVMGEDGQPTPVDWGKEFVIAVVNPVTDQATELTPESLSLENGELVFTYTETVGERQSWTMRPILLIKVDRKYGAETIRLSRISEE
jgi:hypothetical protein